MTEEKTPASRKAGRRIIYFFILVFLCVAGIYGAARFSSFPQLEGFIRQPVSREILDRRGGLLYREHLPDGTRRMWVPLEEIPSGVIQAFIAGEDRRFYLHPGIDPVSVVRAAWQNLRGSRKVSGASTISMQLARIISPHRGDIPGKLHEMWNAFRLESRFSKDEILELYLNRVPFGRGNEGVGSAALAYFAIPLQSMSPPQAAVLSVIPRSPSTYDPVRQPERLKAAAKIVGERMKPPQLGSEISTAVEESAAAQRVSDPMRAAHFVLRAVREHPQDTEMHPSMRSSLRTSLDPVVQRSAESLVSQAVHTAADHRVQNAAVLVIDNHSGEILAYVGSPDFFREDISGQIDAVRIRRQPGSTLKPFLYAQALDSGYSAASILPDIPLALGGSEVYIPQNFDRSFSGPVRLREALASSLNVPAVWMASRLGVQSFVGLLEGLGFDLESQRNSVGTGIALGNVEVSLEELSRAYTAFVNGGRSLDLSFVPLPETRSSRSAQKTGSALAAGSAREAQRSQGAVTPGPPISAHSAGIIRDILGDASARSRGFGQYQLLRTPYPSFFKTGTANQFSNIWAVGVSPDITVGVWMGNVHGQSVQGVTGSSLPAQVAVGILDRFSSLQSSFPDIPDVHKIWISSISGMAVDPSASYAIQELFPLGSFPAQDTWHRGTSGQIRYPAEYIPWARDYRFPHLNSAGGESADFWGRIVYPNNQAQYFVDPYIEAGGFQALRIEAIGEAASMELYLNSRLIANGSPPLAVYEPLQSGRHILELRDSSGSLLDRVQFRVGR
ncbi:penicillin-binding protein 1C [Spirochaeta dissipatitropha]